MASFFEYSSVSNFQKASALMMLGDKVSAIEAERLNMIYKVFSDDVFADFAKFFKPKVYYSTGLLE